MGYCTLYGDAVGALAVIGDLTKTEVYAVGRWYNASRGQEIIPTAIFDKAPSAELRPGQKDEDSLPPYDQLDPVLEGLLASSAPTATASFPARSGGGSSPPNSNAASPRPPSSSAAYPSAPAGQSPSPAATACPRAGRKAGRAFFAGEGGTSCKK